MKEEKTNRALLLKGVKLMGFCLITMFLGPILMYLSFSNKDESFFVPLLILAGFVCLIAIYLLFKGIKTITDSIFRNS